MTYDLLKTNLTPNELDDFESKYMQLLMLSISLKEQLAELKEILRERNYRDDKDE